MPIELFLPFASDLLTERLSLLERRGQGAASMNMDAAMRAQMERDVATRARDFVLRRILDAYDETELAAFEEAWDSDDEATLRDLVDGKQEVVTESMTQFRSVYLGTLLDA